MTKEIALIVPPFGCIIIFDINYVYAYLFGYFGFYRLINIYRGESSHPIRLDALADFATSDVVSLAPSISLVVSDILVVVATWYYISRTSSMRTQLAHDMWTARPNLITVMFRHGQYQLEYAV